MIAPPAIGTWPLELEWNAVPSGRISTITYLSPVAPPSVALSW